jgi:sugar phosphate isomerase/epimerase
MQTIKFGTVQGRLVSTKHNQLQVFPGNQWEAEFAISQKMGLDFIEFFVERDFNEGNPLWSSEGIKRMRDLATASKQDIYSSCIDLIINHSATSGKSGFVEQKIDVFISQSALLGCKLLVFPFLEKSSIDESNFSATVELLRYVAERSAALGMEVAIESMLDSRFLLQLVAETDRQNLGVVFDTGNRVGLSKDLGEELADLMPWVKHVHIKDKDADGNNVRLGSGLVNFLDVFLILRKSGYSGALVFETTRGNSPIRTMKHNIAFCEYFWEESDGV